jgi:hypothetical protein
MLGILGCIIKTNSRMKRVFRIGTLDCNLPERQDMNLTEGTRMDIQKLPGIRKVEFMKEPRRKEILGIIQDMSCKSSRWKFNLKNKCKIFNVFCLLLLSSKLI